MTSDSIIVVSESRASRRLGEAVALDDGAREANFEEVNNLFLDGGRARDHIADLTAKERTHLLKDNGIPATVRNGTIGLVVGHL